MNLLDLPRDVLSECVGDIRALLVFRTVCRATADLTIEYKVELLGEHIGGRCIPFAPRIRGLMYKSCKIYVDGLVVAEIPWGSKMNKFMYLYAHIANAAGCREILWCLTEVEGRLTRAMKMVKYTRYERTGELHTLYVAPADVIAGLCDLRNYVDAIW